MAVNKVLELLGTEGEALLNHECKTISKSLLHLPGSDFVTRSFGPTNRNPQVLRSLEALYNHGRLAGTGYVSILPVDQGIEHSAGASFAPNPIYFDPENIVKLAIEGGCNGVASTFGVLASCSRKYATILRRATNIKNLRTTFAPQTTRLFTTTKRMSRSRAIQFSTKPTFLCKLGG